MRRWKMFCGSDFSLNLPTQVTQEERGHESAISRPVANLQLRPSRRIYFSTAIPATSFTPLRDKNNGVSKKLGPDGQFELVVPLLMHYPNFPVEAYSSADFDLYRPYVLTCGLNRALFINIYTKEVSGIPSYRSF